MDRFRGERFGEGGGRHSRVPSRWSDGPNVDQHHRYQDAREGGGGDGFAAGRHHPYRRGSFDHAPPRGGGGRNPGFRSGSGGGIGSFNDLPTPMGGMRHGGGGGFLGSDRGRSPNKDNFDGSKFAKLFIGSVPRTATEQEIRPLFEEHGHVIEVALIKDKRTGQQQGCCFIKYATQEEADRAIRALHNQVTLPGGVGPIQVRYADGERERLGAVEHKLFVGSLNRQATEKEVEEIFSQYGRVEDVYLMRDESKQSRGCGFVKFSSREMATDAINGLNGTFLMRGCDQPLIVRFADPKRPRPGESRGGPSFGGPGFNTRPQGPSGARFIGDPIGQPIDGWHFDKDSLASSPPHGFNSHFQPKGGYPGAPSASGFSPGNIHPVGQRASPQQQQMSPQHLPTAMHLQQNQQNMTSYLQAAGHVSHLQTSLSSGFPSVTQPAPSNQFLSLGTKLPSSQPLLPQGTPSTLQSSLNLQGAVGSVNQQQLPGLSISQLLQQPVQQVPSQLLLHQQGQALQSGLQPSQQTLSQLQQQLQLTQPSSLAQQQLQLLQPSGLGLQQSTHNVKEQLISTTAVVPSATSPTHITGQGPLTCSWTEHTSPQGFKYYYNSVTKESRWEKPEELILFEQQQKLQHQQQQQQQQQQKYSVHSQSQMPTTSENQPSQQLSQMQQVQSQIQLRQQGQLQQLHALSYQAPGLATNQNIQELSYSQLQGAGSGFDSAHMQKGPQASSQDWMWRNKTGGV